MGGNRRQRVASRRQHLGGEARFAQITCDEIGDVSVVFDDQDAVAIASIRGGDY